MFNTNLKYFFMINHIKFNCFSHHSPYPYWILLKFFLFWGHHHTHPFAKKADDKLKHDCLLWEQSFLWFTEKIFFGVPLHNGNLHFYYNVCFTRMFTILIVVTSDYDLVDSDSHATFFYKLIYHWCLVLPYSIASIKKSSQI